MLLALALACLAPQVIDRTPKVPWSYQDYLALDTAKTTCKLRYPQAPCLVRFYRQAQGTYRAVCGQRPADDAKECRRD